MSYDEGLATGPDRSAQAVEAALAELRRGRMILVVDDEDRENEGDLIMAAELARPEAMAFMIRHTSGLLCVGITEKRAEQLRLPLMVTNSDDPRGTAFTVSVDLRVGTSTGVSAADRAATVQALAGDRTQPEDLTRPGHVFPLIAREGGVLRRAGHTESAVDLCRLAGLDPAGVLAEVTNDDGTMARRPQLARFAAEHGLVTIAVADIVRYRRRTESLVRRDASGRVPSEHGPFTAITYRSPADDCEHVALVLGEVNQAGAEPGSAESAPVLVRVHSECLTGDVFASRRCDCGEQLAVAMTRIGEAGRGVVVYLRGHEGRGIGLSHKLRAYNLQDAGLDTVDANLAQGLPVDSREYGIGAQILRDLGVREIRLMTNNPAKYRGLAGHGVRVATRESIVITPNPDNISYLTAKRIRMDHQLGGALQPPAGGSEVS
ncbi:bifunctional 3,4-dihydroxy-2-butanone-4-phosphate synthase/GTP cyclohydrolase II [Pseudonocardia broussonetiae]|uniref:Riboflavin biosynthesis protein RibBA n=1 Tax=Pseudonocardia broussonetiae TaxID=2736640 RepID=A0A6M6JSL7_9PSEU|nr:bifunctional 3,4-dihydroxy-2-butanone-4-phosphate synthase/GTP cyclohydrolase II [Pseudonocardia broussonetiae]QJY51094.1 bifunctional 3,4-dihydroxy-2-butanone-4-phosphate synthase/GTP cyclohydrolase II [Pseudonocardia broussonetiae]